MAKHSTHTHTLPDYEACSVCGFDHEYEFQAALDWHNTHTPIDPLNVANLRGFGVRLLASGAALTAIAEPMTRHGKEIGLNDSELKSALNNLEALVEPNY